MSFFLTFSEISEIISEPLILEPLFPLFVAFVSSEIGVGLDKDKIVNDVKLKGTDQKLDFNEAQCCKTFSQTTSPILDPFQLQIIFPLHYDIHHSLWSKLKKFTKSFLQSFPYQNLKQTIPKEEFDFIGGECEYDTLSSNRSGKYTDTFRSTSGSTLCESNVDFNEDRFFVVDEKRDSPQPGNEAEDWYRFILYFHDRLFLMESNSTTAPASSKVSSQIWELPFHDDSFNVLVGICIYSSAPSDLFAS